MSTIRLEPLSGTRQPGESNKAVQACNDYLRMGPGRSLTVLIGQYKKPQDNSSPTTKWNTLTRWSSDYRWQDRAALYDKGLEDAKNARAREIMRSGLALDYERVVELKALADFLKGQIYTQSPVIVVTQPAQAEGQPAAAPQVQISTGEAYPYVWLHDVKQIGQGQGAQRVDIIRFNSAILEQFRGVLDDLAKETGGRVSKHEMSGPNGGPVAIDDANHNRAISSLATALGALVLGSGTGSEGDLGTAVETAVGSAADEGV